MPATLFVPPAPVATSAVFGVTEDKKRYRLSNATSNDEALKEWYRLDDERMYTTLAQTIDGVRVRFYAVRDINDPDWADAPEGDVTTHELHPIHFRAKGRGPLKAVREWAEAQGYEGREGGWIYRDDKPVAHGWASFTHTNFKRLRMDAKCVDAALAHHFGINAPKPRKKAARGPVTRTVDGIKWISQGEESWRSEDGRYDIEHVHDFETECDEPHPMRITQADRDAYYALSEFQRNHSPAFPWHIRQAIESGKRGYLCEGGEIHFYSLWVAGPTATSDIVITRTETFKEAAQKVARYSRGEIQPEG